LLQTLLASRNREVTGGLLGANSEPLSDASPFDNPIRVAAKFRKSFVGNLLAPDGVGT
jgi:hypothetical protein